MSVISAGGPQQQGLSHGRATSDYTVVVSSPRSVRFDDDVIRRLDRYVRSHPGTSASSVANIFVDEALRTEEHPGIMFRPGPTGRRAGLVGGPDVWEVIGALEAVRAEDPDLVGESLVEAVAEVAGLYLHAVETDAAQSSFTVFLSKAPGREVRIGWFALG